MWVRKLWSASARAATVHRKFTGFLAEGAAAIAAGTKIVAGNGDEKEVGEMTSVAVLRTGSGEQTRGAWDIFGARWECRGAR